MKKILLILFSRLILSSCQEIFDLPNDGRLSYDKIFSDYGYMPKLGMRYADAGLQALMVLAFQAGSERCTALGDNQLARKCTDMVTLMKKNIPDHNNLKQAAALLALADMLPAQQANSEVIAVGGAKHFSTFYGYYMLQAQAKAADYQTAIDIIRKYWGGLLDMGTTSFWEDFDLDWTENAARIDEFLKAKRYPC